MPEPPLANSSSVENALAAGSPQNPIWRWASKYWQRILGVVLALLAIFFSALVAYLGSSSGQLTPLLAVALILLSAASQAASALLFSQYGKVSRQHVAGAMRNIDQIGLIAGRSEQEVQRAFESGTPMQKTVVLGSISKDLSYIQQHAENARSDWQEYDEKS